MTHLELRGNRENPIYRSLIPLSPALLPSLANKKPALGAASTDCWKKYVGTEGLTFGIDTFGKSAPYKEIYRYFGLTAENISKRTKNLIKS